MEKKICSVCGESIGEELKHCPYCDSIFVSVEDIKNEILSDNDIYEEEISNSYERYYL